jgi:predicted ATP-grasp superfamily ATP-dependent carboligase
MTYATDHWEDYAAPELVVHLLWDSAGHPFLLLTGPEPDRRWEAFIQAVRSLIDRWGVRLTMGFHGIPMGVPHTRPLNVIGHATRPELVSEYQPFFNRVQVPGNVSGLLEFRLGQAGHDAMGFAAQVPHYLAQSQYPTAAVTLLDVLARATGLALPIGGLADAAQAADAEIHRQVAESEEVAQVVEALERQYDAFIQTVGNTDLPSADELGAEFERFLAEQQRPPDHL